MAYIKLAYEGQICLLTLCRERQYNALNTAMLRELSQALAEIKARQDLRCLIISGAGEKAFVAGADIGELAGLDWEGARGFSVFGQEVLQQIQDCPLPVIAAVRGFALGGGCELALSCDMRIAAADAVFGLPETSLGVMPGWGGTQRLARLVGYARAMELALSGKRLTAAQAYDIGLVNQVVEPEALPEAALALARKISANAPLGVRATKKAMRQGAELDLAAALELESVCFANLFETDDAKQGLKAFVDKTAYAYEGK